MTPLLTLVSSRNSRGVTSIVWFTLSAVGLLWPSRVLGPLDGIPLAGALEPVVIALLFPVLAITIPNVLDKRSTRAIVLTLLLWKLVTSVFLTQQGWTGTFWLPTSQVSVGTTTLERNSAAGGPLPRPPWIRTPPPTWPAGPQGSWDVRARWGGTARRVSAIVDRAHPTLTSFPAWFLNMLDAGTPPNAPFTFDVEGHLAVEAPGTLSFAFTPGDVIDVTIDSQQLGRVDTGDVVSVSVAPGTHHVRIQLTFRGNSWRFVPLWNGQDLWASACTTVHPPTKVDRALWKTTRWVTTALVLLLFASWLGELFRVRWVGVPVIAWTAGASGAMAMAAQWETPGRLSPLLLFGSAMLPVGRRLGNVYGAFLLLGIPWLAFIASKHQFEVGHFTFYSLGDDWMNYQRFAHRIYMEGYWLEGGEPTFWWQQPLYRWMIAALHLVFGDSSVGQAYWDGACLLVSALFACHIVKAVAGFRWGLVAGSMTLVTFAVSPIWYLIGRGLSEIAAAGWVYVAALCLLRSRLGRIRWAIAASMFATLAFYTRLNHLPFLVVILVLAFPRHPRAWVTSARRTGTIAATYLAGLAVGTGIFALRTWYYTGEFSILYGTQRDRLSTTLGVATVFSTEAWQHALASVWMVITIQQPGRLNLRALAVTFGVAIAGLVLARMPPLHRIPLALAIVCWGALTAPLLVYSWAYIGRASVHLVPVAVAIFVSALAVSAKTWPFRTGGRSVQET